MYHFGDNPNKVSREHFEYAVELAGKCKPEQRGKIVPRVGAVVVKDGVVISHGFRGEGNTGRHAEFIALHIRGDDKSKISGSDLVVTLEPCTKRSKDKKPCVDWIKKYGIRKVWIGTSDFNPEIAGNGTLQLEEGGILIGRFPNGLDKRIRELNEVFLDEIKKKKPSIENEQLKRERQRIRNSLERKRNKALTKSEMDRLDAALFFGKEMNYREPAHWSTWGDFLLNANEIGYASTVFTTATIMDNELKHAWIGKARSEFRMNIEKTDWPDYLICGPIDSKSEKYKAEAWLELLNEYDDLHSQLRIIARAIQVGKRDKRITQILREIDSEIENLDIPDLSHVEDYMVIISNIWFNLGFSNESEFCKQSSEKAKKRLLQLRGW